MSNKNIKEKVFERDGHKCIVCGRSDLPLDAHHIIERRLWEDGGWYLDNLATLCDNGKEGCHYKAEQTKITVDEILSILGIVKPLLPEDMYEDQRYDKWGNVYLTNGKRSKGPLFHDESVQKVLADVLDEFTDYYKYPRTYHCPWSEGATEDDKVNKSMSGFIGKEVIVTVKMDGECFPSITKISMMDGTKKQISKIKKGDVVVGFDENNGCIVPSIVKNTYFNGETENWVKLWYECANIKNRKKFVICTADHNFKVGDNLYRAVEEIDIGDEIYHLYNKIEPSDIQKQILLGKLLGDGSFGGKLHNIVQYSHKIDHKEYSLFINSSLNDVYSSSCIDTNKNSFSGKNKFVSRTKSFDWIEDLYHKMYASGKKEIPVCLVDDITVLSLAILYMDDGHLKHSNSQKDIMSISVCNFNKESCRNLQLVFDKLGIKTTVTNSDGYNYLHISSKSVDKFSEMILEYVPPIMQYKLPKKYRGNIVNVIDSGKCSNEINNIKVKVLKKEIIKNYPYKGKYDIETTTSNYYAKGVLVHNCSSIYKDYFHARSLDSNHHYTRDWAKSYAMNFISPNIPEGWRVCAENLYAVHSIKYENLKSYLIGFSIWNDLNECLSWDETKEYFQLLNMPYVEVLYEGIYDEDKIKGLYDASKYDKMEGYVIRVKDSFKYKDFKKYVAKFVRKDHVQTSKHWIKLRVHPTNDLKEGVDMSNVRCDDV